MIAEAPYQIHYKEQLVEGSDFTPYGGNREAMYCREHEFIVSGPAETGKTIGMCWKIHLMAMKYAGAQGAIIRKRQTDVYGSVLQTFERVIDGAPVYPYGGQRPQKYNYDNGSVIWVGGMDKPGKVLSSERDFVYVNQAEELLLDDWESITTRTTGRGAVMPYTMTFGDANPGGSKHWIVLRAKEGKLKLIPTTHKDNPSLYDPLTGNLTEQGRRSLEQLSKLTGIRRKRLFEGIWATAEGAVFDMFDSAVHVRTQDQINYKNFRLAADEGYKHPAVILVIGEDNDRRRHVFEEFYKSGVLQADVVAEAKRLGMKYGTNRITVDESAAGLIADLKNEGLDAVGGKGRVLDRIYAIQDDLALQLDKRPRLTFDPSCVETINDFESYRWHPLREEPIKEDDDGPDALGYDYDNEGHIGGGFAVGYRGHKDKRMKRRR